ncbi:nuclear transport factor 2 family protein [Pseudonocardia oroxyli]|uniref:nuclear transport factor 2 family protein n=1 Tax=Pseudonocardia oroxyli TaxID=366584 RepID=UPI000B83EBA4|nr:nuclear transport factor 2 family protein [Pseudonocardia oroxyli]
MLRRPRLPAPPTTRRGTAILAGVTVVLVALAVLAGVSWWTMSHTAAARNAALVDVAATTQVSQQLGDAVKTVYSYDFTRLDQNEAAARTVITPEFGQQFDQLFGEVRNLAPQQQAVVTATISQSAVESIEGDRATMVVFLDQQATRAAGDQQQVAAAGRLTVTGQYVDGQWKIADVQVA